MPLAFARGIFAMLFARSSFLATAAREKIMHAS
jgi:hypothetical protein